MGLLKTFTDRLGQALIAVIPRDLSTPGPIAGVDQGDGTCAVLAVIGNAAGSTMTLPPLPYNADAIPNGSAYGPFVGAEMLAYNGATTDRVRVDPNATGVLRTSTGGAVTVPFAAATGGVVKASAGRLARVLVTTPGTAALSIYDNAAAAAGTIIGYIPANATAGSVYAFDMPAANGIFVPTVANAPAITVSYY